MPSKTYRCPEGSRRNRKTGECDWFNSKVLYRSKYGQKSKLTKVTTKPKSRKRCPKGTRRLGRTGKCSNKSIKDMTLGTRDWLKDMFK